MVPGDNNGTFDIFVRNRKTGTTERVSLGSHGVQSNAQSASPAISADGRYVAFRSRATNWAPGESTDYDDVFIRDRKTGTTERVSLGAHGEQGNDQSARQAISANGRFVTFDSFASNLVSGDTNGVADIFIHDRKTGTTRRVSLGRDDTQTNSFSDNPVITPDGRSIAFWSDASNPVPGDTNEQGDVFIRTLIH